MKKLIIPLLVIIILSGIAASTITPLLSASPTPTLLIGGLLPSTAHVHRPINIDLELDNTGDTAIAPACMTVTETPPAFISTALFAGTDHIQIKNGRFCGGQLPAHESISVIFSLTPMTTSSIHITVTPTTGAHLLGRGLSTVIAVS